jgi:hypothetical protein
MEVASQWNQGIIYPQWAGSAQWGYGDPRFIFYPPLSWLLGGALGLVLPWKAVPGAFVFLALGLSGCSMFVVARQFFNWRESLLTAVFYTANPYYFVLIYWRSAYAELLAGAALPFLLINILRLGKTGTRAVIALAVTLAIFCLTNIPASIMVAYALAVCVVILAVNRRSLQPILRGGAAVLLAGGLAAFYLFPAAYEQKWVSAQQLLSAGVRPIDNFLFTKTGDFEHDRFNILVSRLGLGQIAITSLFVMLLWQRKRVLEKWRLSDLRPFFVAWTALSALLMFHFSSVAWNHLPRLSYVQFPWRWLLLLNVAFVFAGALALERWRWRALAFFVLIMILGYGWREIKPPSWESAREIQAMLEQQTIGAGYEGVDEYVPAEGDAYELNRLAPEIKVADNVPALISITDWRTESKIFDVKSDHAVTLLLRLFYYPAWEIEVNGKTTTGEPDDNNGQLTLHVPAGYSHVQVTFRRAWDRKYAFFISFFAWIAVIWLVVPAERKIATV